MHWVKCYRIKYLNNIELVKDMFAPKHGSCTQYVDLLWLMKLPCKVDFEAENSFVFYFVQKRLFLDRTKHHLGLLLHKMLPTN